MFPGLLLKILLSKAPALRGINSPFPFLYLPKNTAILYGIRELFKRYKHYILFNINNMNRLQCSLVKYKIDDQFCQMMNICSSPCKIALLILNNAEQDETLDARFSIP